MSPAAPTRGLVFYPASHRYKLDGKWVPGVTTILGVLDKPAIPKWAATQVAEWVADNPDGLEHLRNMGRGPMVQALKSLPWQKRDDAGTRGNLLHDYAEALLRGQEVDVDPDSVPVMENAVAFLSDWRIRPLMVEVPVASRAHQWAGTADLFAEYRRPDTGEEGVAIFDWKSGKALYPEYAWQLAAYGHAEFALVDGQEVPVPKCQASFGVQIRGDGYDVAPFAYGDDVYAEFVTFRAAHDAVKRGRGDWKRPGTGYDGLFVQPHDEQGGAA